VVDFIIFTVTFLPLLTVGCLKSPRERQKEEGRNGQAARRLDHHVSISCLGFPLLGPLLESYDPRRPLRAASTATTMTTYLWQILSQQWAAVAYDRASTSEAFSLWVETMIDTIITPALADKGVFV